MATPEDLAANADYIRMADQYVEVSRFPRQGYRPFDSRLFRMARKIADPVRTGAWWHQQQQLCQRRTNRRYR